MYDVQFHANNFMLFANYWSNSQYLKASTSEIFLLKQQCLWQEDQGQRFEAILKPVFHELLKAFFENIFSVKKLKSDKIWIQNLTGLRLMVNYSDFRKSYCGWNIYLSHKATLERMLTIYSCSVFKGKPYVALVYYINWNLNLHLRNKAITTFTSKHTQVF